MDDSRRRCDLRSAAVGSRHGSSAVSVVVAAAAATPAAHHHTLCLVCQVPCNMAAITTPYLDKYLERVGQHSGASLPPTLSTLARLHYAHATTIPFENLSLKLDVAARQHGINIDLAAVYKKLVLSRRGG